MNLMQMTAESLSKSLGETVPDMYVVIAKNSVAGLDSQAIAELLGAETAEVTEIEADQIYKNVRLLIATEYGRGRVDADFSWDALEQSALRNLTKRMHLEADPDFNLKVAVMANKAQRRLGDQAKGVLDPSTGGARVPLSLTSRIVKRLNQKTGDMELEETRTISLTDGSAVNPSFEDIDKMFGVSARPAIAENLMSRVADTQFSVDDLAEEFIAGRTR